MGYMPCRKNLGCCKECNGKIDYLRIEVRQIIGQGLFHMVRTLYLKFQSEKKLGKFTEPKEGKGLLAV